MTDSFMSYREDFQHYRDEAMKEIKEMSQASTKQQRDGHLAKATNNIQEAERHLRVLEAESKAGDSQQRRKMQQQFRTCQSHVEKLHNNLKRAQLLAESAERSKEQSKTNDPQQRDINYQNRLDRTGDHLVEAQRTIANTEDIAININTNLARQREHIERARTNVQETRDNTQEASGHLSSLGRKAFTNLWLLRIIILGLLAGITYGVITKIQGKEDKK